MRSTFIATLILTLAFFASGCTRMPGGIAASNIPLSPGGYTPLSHVGASDCKINLFGIIPISGANYTQDALEKAIGKSGGNALINITVESVSAYYILWSQTCTEVRGTAVQVTY